MSRVVLLSMLAMLDLTATTLASPTPTIEVATAAQPMQLALQNKIPGSSVVYGYVVGYNSGGVGLFLSPSGTWQNICPLRQGSGIQQVPADHITINVGAYQGMAHVNVPNDMSSCRLYVSEEPLDFATTDGCSLMEPSFLDMGLPNANRSWSFMEFSFAGTAVYVNPSNVDFVGIPLSLALTGADDTTQSVPGLVQNAREGICAGLEDAGKRENKPWGKLCHRRSDGKALRILSPEHAGAVGVTDFNTYWNEYVNNVWGRYTDSPLTVNQQDIGTVKCQTQGQNLVCGGASFSRPTGGDIWGCNTGPFANQDNGFRNALIPILCAAFHRATLLSSPTQPNQQTANWYQGNFANAYSSMVHKHAADARVYAFAYDDVGANGQDFSGTVSTQNARSLAIGIGGA